LDGPEFDESVAHVWRWWLEVHPTRDDDRAIKWTELEAYLRLRRIDPLREELILFDAIEDEYLAYRREQWKLKEEERLKKQT
jgi:hypothetical protein